jgi:hypothetical protein
MGAVRAAKTVRVLDGWLAAMSWRVKLTEPRVEPLMATTRVEKSGDRADEENSGLSCPATETLTVCDSAAKEVPARVTTLARLRGTILGVMEVMNGAGG